MTRTESIKIGVLKSTEVEEADRIVRVAFGTYLGLPNPANFMGDRSYMKPRWAAGNTTVLAAREGSRLIGSNVLTRWGSFAYFGPLTVLPEYWDKGVASLLMEATMKVFKRWGVRHTGLFTFAQSAKHVGLYQKFGYWPRYLTSVMTFTPQVSVGQPMLLTGLRKADREEAILACARLTDKIDEGLDLTGEIKSVLKHSTGDVMLTYTRGVLDGFAVAMHGPGSEGGASICYVKFAAVRGGRGAGERLDKLLESCEAFALARGAHVEAGVNLAREEVYRRMRARGYRVILQGVAMQRPNSAEFNRPDAFVIDDWM